LVHLVSPHVVSAAEGHEVVEQLHAIHALEAITSLIDLRVVGGAGLTHLLDSVTEEVLIGPRIVIAKGLHEVRVVLNVELEVKDVRAGTALLDTVVLPVSAELGIVVVESILKVRILVVIEVRIEDEILDITRHGGDSHGSEAHGGDHALRTAHVAEVPDELAGGEVGEEGIDSLIDLRVVGGAGLTHLLDSVTEVVLISLGVVSAKGLHEVRVVLNVELEVEDVRAGTALLDTVVLPVSAELGIVVVESILKVRILVVIEVRVEDDLLHIHGRIGRNTIQHHFRWFYK